jgi:Recombinase
VCEAANPRSFYAFNFLTIRDRLAPVYRAVANERARQLAPVLTELMITGMSDRRMAAELMARGIPTPNGAKWHGKTVRRIIDRLTMPM